MPHRRVWLLAAVAVVALSSAGAGLWWWSYRFHAQPEAHFVEVSDGAYILPRPDELAPFALTTHADRPFDNASLKGKWTFLFFGYTHCPDICPVTLKVFDDVQHTLRGRPEGAADLQFVFVSVDPERDTPALLKEYVPQFNPEFIGVSGNGAELARLSDSLGVVYAKVAGSAPDQYFMDHSTAVLLTDPQGRLRGIFSAPHTPQQIVTGFIKIREQSR
jgi:protein SCO1/2